MSNRVIAAGILLGIGLGGFLDGILFHQILQTHNMLTGVRPKTDLVSAEINMFWDGMFHVFTWLMTASGLALLWKNVRRATHPLSTRAFVGSLLLGFGMFNFVEGLIDHHILHLHHVVEAMGVSVFDYLFLASGVLLSGAGVWLIRAGLVHAPADGPTTAPRLHPSAVPH